MSEEVKDGEFEAWLIEGYKRYRHDLDSFSARVGWQAARRTPTAREKKMLELLRIAKEWVEDAAYPDDRAGHPDAQQWLADLEDIKK